MICVLLGLVSRFHGNKLAPRSHPAVAGVASSYLAASYSAWRLPICPSGLSVKPFQTLVRIG